MNSIWSEVAALFGASVILITSIAWSNALQTWVDSTTWFSGNPIWGAFLYAMILTLISGVILAWLRPFRSQEIFRQEPKN